MNSFAFRRVLPLLLLFLGMSKGFAGVILSQHIFTTPIGGLNPDGANPAAGLVLSGGLLCGTTMNGGAQGAGTAFCLAPDATGFNAFRAFAGAPDGAYPRSELSFSGTRLFGATFGGGSNGVGTVFAGQTNGSVTVLRSFSAVWADNATNSGGASPIAVLAVAGGTIFGTTGAGGASGNGTVFAMNTNGTGYTVLHNFTTLDVVSGTNTDGATPAGGLLLGGNTVYGTTSAGGAGGSGTVFSMGTNGGNFTSLHHFSAMDPISGANADGAVPMSSLLLTNNVLYGATVAGGQGGSGVIFSLGTNGAGFSVLHHFSATESGTNADGASSCAAPAFAGGVLYGTAAAGGPGANGTIYSVRTNGSEFKALYSFSALDAATGTNSDGALPTGGLVVLGNILYGTTFSGGPGGAGTVFGLRVPYPPAVITNVVLNPDRSVTLVFAGGPNSMNVVQRTENLSSPVSWQDLATNIADEQGLWQFTETNPDTSPRFYRSYAP